MFFFIDLELCISFLETIMVNKYVLASHLGHNLVRVYTGEKELFARILVDKGLATMADSYSFPKASSLPAILPVDPEEPGDDGRAPTPAPKKHRLMKEVKALGIGPQWRAKIGQRKRRQHITYQH